jgi:hypothetical protein
MVVKSCTFLIRSGLGGLKCAVTVAAALSEGVFEAYIERVKVEPGETAVEKALDLFMCGYYGVQVKLRYEDEAVINPFYGRLQALANRFKWALIIVPCNGDTDQGPLKKSVRISTTETDEKSVYERRFIHAPLYSPDGTVDVSLSKQLIRVPVPPTAGLKITQPTFLMVTRGLDALHTFKLNVTWDKFSKMQLLAMLNDDAPADDWIYDILMVRRCDGQHRLEHFESVAFSDLNNTFFYGFYTADLGLNRHLSTGKIPFVMPDESESVRSPLIYNPHSRNRLI